MFETWMTICLASVGLLLAIATFIPLLRCDYWLVRVLDFPRLQIVTLLVAVCLGWVLVWSPTQWWFPTMLVALLATIGYQCALVFPFTPLAKKQASDVDPNCAIDAPTIRLFIANVLQENRSADQLIDLIKCENPDIVLVVECDQWWSDRLNVITESRPHRVSHPIGNTYGMDLFSRFPLHNVTIRELTAESVPSIRAELELDDGTRVLFYGLHPPPPWPDEALTSTARDAELVIVGKEIKEAKRPTIVAGDLNDVAWSRTTSMFQEISGLLDPRIGRGLYNSFSAKNPFARWPLDHVFFSADFSLVELRRLESFGSDHFPILLEIALAPPIEAHKLPKRADAQTDGLAEEKLEQQQKEGAGRGLVGRK